MKTPFFHTTLIAMLLISNCLNAQKITIGYFPEFTGNVSKQEYEFGKELLEGAYQQIKSTDNIKSADYWNVAAAYNKMGVEANKIKALLKKFKSLDSSLFCLYVEKFIEQAGGIENTGFYETLGYRYKELTEDCSFDKVKPRSIKTMMLEKKDENLNGLNEQLIDRLITLFEKDQRYRYKTSIYYSNLDKQNKLDKEVQKELTSIFETYGYPGKKLVGNKYANYACVLFEHVGGDNSEENLAFKYKYLPLVLRAYRSGDIKQGYMKMLIDRVHLLKDGKQIYGTQSNTPFYRKDSIIELKKQYKI